MLRMTDFRLLAIKHGRVMILLIMVIIALAIVRVVSDELVVQQIYGIGVMLVEIAITLYALDAVLRLTGACDDRLLLLSPLSRWHLAVCNMLVLSLYLLCGYGATLLPLAKSSSVDGVVQLANLLGYIVSIFTGLGLMLLVSYALKNIRTRFPYLLSAWFVFSVTILLAVIACVLMLKKVAPEAQWLLGVTSSDSIVNLYSASLPVTVIGLGDQVNNAFFFIAANMLLGIIVWLSAFMLSRRKNNFIRL